MERTVRFTWDKAEGLGYIYFGKIRAGGVAHTFECPPGDVCGHMINLDFDAEGKLVGIELIDAAKALPESFLSGTQE